MAESSEELCNASMQVYLQRRAQGLVLPSQLHQLQDGLLRILARNVFMQSGRPSIAAAVSTPTMKRWILFASEHSGACKPSAAAALQGQL